MEGVFMSSAASRELEGISRPFPAYCGGEGKWRGMLKPGQALESPSIAHHFGSLAWGRIAAAPALR
jgi:hypothetical protein